MHPLRRDSLLLYKLLTLIHSYVVFESSLYADNGMFLDSQSDSTACI